MRHAASSPQWKREQVRVPCFSVVSFSRGTLPTKRGERRALLGDLGVCFERRPLTRELEEHFDTDPCSVALQVT